MECCSPEFCSVWSALGILVRGTGLEAGSRGSLGPMPSLIGAIAWSAGIIYSRPFKAFRQPTSSFPLFLCWLVQQCCSQPAAHGRRSERFGHQQNITTKSWLAFAYLIVFGSNHCLQHAYNWLAGTLLAHAGGHATLREPYRLRCFLAALYGGEALTLKVGIAAALVGRGRSLLVDRGTNNSTALA